MMKIRWEKWLSRCIIASLIVHRSFGNGKKIQHEKVMAQHKFASKILLIQMTINLLEFSNMTWKDENLVKKIIQFHLNVTTFYQSWILSFRHLWIRDFKYAFSWIVYECIHPYYWIFKYFQSTCEHWNVISSWQNYALK